MILLFKLTDRCQNADEARVKEQHLKMVSARERMAKCKADLDDSDTDNKMAQLALDKAAQEFRQLHAERQEMADRCGHGLI